MSIAGGKIFLKPLTFLSSCFLYSIESMYGQLYISQPDSSLHTELSYYKFIHFSVFRYSSQVVYTVQGTNEDTAQFQFLDTLFRCIQLTLYRHKLLSLYSSQLSFISSHEVLRSLNLVQNKESCQFLQILKLRSLKLYKTETGNIKIETLLQVCINTAQTHQVYQVFSECSGSVQNVHLMVIQVGSLKLLYLRLNDTVITRPHPSAQFTQVYLQTLLKPENLYIIKSWECLYKFLYTILGTMWCCTLRIILTYKV
jgi:hypothetical protein